MKLTADLRFQLMLRPAMKRIFRTGADLPSLPSVWDRARSMFGHLMERIGSTASLSQKRLRQAERFELMLWLKPLEDLVRSWLVARAVTWLLMSETGRKLRYVKWHALRRHKYSKIIPHPGWHTIARHWQPEPEPPQRPPPREPRDRYDPDNWRCRFRALALPVKPAGRKPIAGADEEGETRNLIHPRTDISTARRIEMIARVMAKPDAAIRRIARSIARLPLSAMQARLDYFTPTGLWMHGEQEYADARAHERCAIRVFYRALEAG